MSRPRSTNPPNSSKEPEPKPQTSFPSVTHLADSLATQSQLIDSLTAHISLYHVRCSSSTPNTNPNPHPRASILKWFSSLTVHQRQAHLTTVDRNFTKLLLQMLAKLHASGGHGRFIILPDLSSSRELPGLCFKKSRGLLSRTAYSDESAQFVYESVWLFGSREGEKIEECSCSINCLDSLTMSEEFVEDVDRFVAVMDKVSNGAFLRGEERELGSHWVELEWLKVKGYYSVEAFVVNRLEVAIRLAWMNCGNGKKRGVKLKEKVSAAGMAATVFWRKKGCVDWWQNLNGDTRRKIFCMALGKSAKALTCEILKEASMAYEDEMLMLREGANQPFRHIYSEPSLRTTLKLPSDAEFGSTIMPLSLFGKYSSSTDVFNHLYALCDIITLILADQQKKSFMSKVFFSTFSSVSTISDCILRKLRGLLMVIQLDCTKLELLGDGNLKPFPDKSKGKNGVGSRKKKGKNHNVPKLNYVPGTVMDASSLNKPHKKLERVLADFENTKSTEMPAMANGIHTRTLSSAVEMEHSQGQNFGKGRNATRKNRKGRNKNKVPISSASLRKSEESVSKEPCSASRSEEPAKFDGLCEGSTIQDDNLIGASAKESVREDTSSIGIQKDHVVSCTTGICPTGPNNLVENQNECLRIGTLNSEEGSNLKCCVLPTFETCTLPGNEDIGFQSKKSVVISDLACKGFIDTDAKEEPVLVPGHEKRDSHDHGSTSPLACLSYEWPSLAPVYFPVNSHLPPATDRLHLDVGNNRHAHIRQPFVSTVHQARKSHIESGCNHMMPRPFPLSLEWPHVVTGACGLAPSLTCNYDSGFISRRQSAFQQSFTAQSMQFNTKSTDDERKHTGDVMDFAENSREIVDDFESHWISEEEFELHAVSGVDYSQYFGGGVMYWNPSDYLGTGFSRPPSLSSDDSSWAWHEADMNRTVDDVVAFPSSYGTNGLTSPTATSFCPTFDPMVPGHQALGYVVSGNEVPGKIMHSSSSMADVAVEEDVSGSLTSLPGDVDSKTVDSLSYPVLRPIIIPNMSREKSRSDFWRSHDHRSPCVPPTRREQPRIKRPPSPVVLCVRAPRPPPPSPVSDSRKHRGFPIVRSGSSSPRHWGVKGWYNDVTTSEDARIRMDGSEVVWPSWRNKNLPTRSIIQPLPGALLQEHLIAISKLSLDQDHPDVSFPLQPPDLQNCPARKASLALMHNLLHDEIDFFFKQVASTNMARKPFINWAVKRVTRSLQVLWPRSRTNVFGSNATGLSLRTSDVDLVVCLPPVRNLEPIKEAGILEGRNGIKETCLQHAARYLANQEWVKNDSLKTVENTAIPIIMLAVEVPSDVIMSAASNVQSPKEEPVHLSGEHDNHIQSDTVVSEVSVLPKCYDSVKDVKSVRLDISFKSPSHTGLQTTELVKELTEQFPASTPLALVLKQFLADRSLDQSYSGGLSSYCLVILITRFLQHEHHLGRPINQNWGSLLMDFLYFFGNVFDPRVMRVSVQGSGVYIKRERGYSIDPIYIDDPLFPTNNVGRNCFRIHQCIKAFSDAYSILENELKSLPEEGDTSSRPTYRLLGKIIPSINMSQGI